MTYLCLYVLANDDGRQLSDNFWAICFWGVVALAVLQQKPKDPQFMILITFSSPPPQKRRVLIKKSDMSEDMQQDAVDCATQVI